MKKIVAKCERCKNEFDFEDGNIVLMCQKCGCSEMTFSVDLMATPLLMTGEYDKRIKEVAYHKGTIFYGGHDFGSLWNVRRGEFFEPDHGGVVMEDEPVKEEPVKEEPAKEELVEEEPVKEEPVKEEPAKEELVEEEPVKEEIKEEVKPKKEEKHVLLKHSKKLRVKVGS